MPDFSALNNFFDHIYIVTLRRAKERHVFIEKNLEGLNYNFFYGADSKEFTIEEVIHNGIYDENATKKHHRYSKTLNGGQIGCAWSHKKIYEDIITKGYQKVLILEDDVFADEAISSLFQRIFISPPSQWDLIYFDYNKNEKRNILKQYLYHLQSFLGLLKWDQQIIRNYYPKKVNDYFFTAGFHDYTSAYALSARGASQLLKMQTPISYLADNLLAIAATKKIINAYISVPKLFHQLSQGDEKHLGSFVDV